MRIHILTIVIFGFFSCTNSKQEINEILENPITNVEKVYDGHLVYSDSAKLLSKIEFVELERQMVNFQYVTYFKKGIKATFYNNREVQSWLEADEAIRDELKKSIVARKNVVLKNKRNDILETSELNWDENKEELWTDKFVRIIQPQFGDTSYGYGFRAKQEFTEFEIGKFSGKGTLPEKK